MMEDITILLWASDFNTDDRSLRRSVHLPVPYSTRVRQFTQSEAKASVQGSVCY
jgi:hypothetical protein